MIRRGIGWRLYALTSTELGAMGYWDAHYSSTSQLRQRIKRYTVSDHPSTPVYMPLNRTPSEMIDAFTIKDALLNTLGPLVCPVHSNNEEIYRIREEKEKR